MYSSEVEYADNPIAKSLKDVARVHLAGLGTRVLYASHGGYDVHANENPTQPKLLGELSGAIMDYRLQGYNVPESEQLVKHWEATWWDPDAEIPPP